MIKSVEKYFATLLLFTLTVVISCNENESIIPDPEYGWGKTMAGNDPEETTWPDLSENYWEFTFNLNKYPKGSVGLRFNGEFPVENTRFFNITVYSDRTTERYGSIEDFNIQPKNGRNPFREEGVTGSSYFEVNAIPSTVDASKYPNSIQFPDSVERITILLRIYFNSIDHKADFGGVELPRITYFDVNTGKDIGEAMRAKSLYYVRFNGILSRIPSITSQPKLYFTLAPNVMYPNGPTGYITTANRMQEDSALMFRFIPPSYAGSVAENTTADVRYWSICVGDLKTYTRTTLVDKDVLIDRNGFANVMIVDENNKDFEAVKIKAEEMKINLIKWNVKKYGEPLMIFYRQMYIRPGYKYSVQNIISFPRLDKFGHPDPTDTKPGIDQLANFVLQNYGPFGYKKSIGFFLDKNFKLEDMRPQY